MDSTELGTFIRLWDTSGEPTDISVEDRNRIDLAYKNWVERGIDSYLNLTLHHGDEYNTRASLIKDWAVSSPDGRLRVTMMEKAVLDEEKQNRVAAGLEEPWEGTP